jgi:hypothetical protein
VGAASATTLMFEARREKVKAITPFAFPDQSL